MTRQAKMLNTGRIAHAPQEANTQVDWRADHHDLLMHTFPEAFRMLAVAGSTKREDTQ